MSNYYTMIAQIANNYDHIIAGDFNIDLLRTQYNNNTKLFLNIMYSNYYFPVILRPTRITNNSCTLIDNIFINNPLITNSGLIICDISDHLPIFVSLSSDKISDLYNMNDAFSDKRYLSNFAVPKLYNELISVDWSFITDYTNIDDGFNKLLDCFMNTYYLLFKPYRLHNVKIKQPWMTNALCTSCAVKHRMYKAMLNGKCSPRQL